MSEDQNNKEDLDKPETNPRFPLFNPSVKVEMADYLRAACRRAEVQGKSLSQVLTELDEEAFSKMKNVTYIKPLNPLKPPT